MFESPRQQQKGSKQNQSFGIRKSFCVNSAHMVKGGTEICERKAGFPDFLEQESFCFHFGMIMADLKTKTEK